MNCLEFESRLEVLAHGALADARQRDAAEAHADSCAPCAARLADERTLSTGLRALAQNMSGAEAPARTEATLLAAFRARAASAASVPAASAASVEGSSDTAAASNVVPLSGHAPTRRWSWAKTFAVASMAAAASLALFVLARQGAQVKAPAASSQTAARPAPQKMIVPPDTNGGAQTTPETARLTQTQVEEPAPLSPASSSSNAPKVNTSRTVFTSRARAVNASYTTGGRTSLAQPSSETHAQQEVATEFIPLVQAGPYAQAEEAHLVRVELPRSALASFGLPVNAEAASSGRVKADVLLGQDGVARAIRFVR